MANYDFHIGLQERKTFYLSIKIDAIEINAFGNPWFSDDYDDDDHDDDGDDNDDDDDDNMEVNCFKFVSFTYQSTFFCPLYKTNKTFLCQINLLFK